VSRINRTNKALDTIFWSGTALAGNQAVVMCHGAPLFVDLMGNRSDHKVLTDVVGERDDYERGALVVAPDDRLRVCGDGGLGAGETWGITRASS